MSTKEAPVAQDARAPAKQVAYGAKQMTDLEPELDWSSIEVLNTASDPRVALSQGLRDQPELLIESDADEQLLLHLVTPHTSYPFAQIFTYVCLMC